MRFGERTEVTYSLIRPIEHIRQLIEIPRMHSQSSQPPQTALESIDYDLFIAPCFLVVTVEEESTPAMHPTHL